MVRSSAGMTAGRSTRATRGGTLKVRRYAHRLASLCSVVGVSLLLVVGSGERAEAYIDPASTSLIWQAVLAGCFGTVLYARQLLRGARSWMKTALGFGKDTNTSVEATDRATQREMSRNL